MKNFSTSKFAFALVSLLAASTSSGQVVLVGMGDSIGEGVQSGDASAVTQQASYLRWVAMKLGVPFPQPIIQGGPLAFVGNTSNRARIFPDIAGLNLSVSGAAVHDVLSTRADAASVDEIDSETDLVLYPRQGSQIEIAEALNPPLIVCWIGNNDVLGAVTAFDQLDASQMTPIAEFTSGYLELTERLSALDGAVVLANIPSVTSIAILADAQDLLRLTGETHGLAEGDYTTLPTVLLLRLGIVDGSVLQDPNYVLDANEVTMIEERITELNEIISDAASAISAPVVDVHQIFDSLVDNPPAPLGIPLTHRFLGGLFSLDGVHPSNVGHALIADQILAATNAFYGTSFPRLTSSEFLQTLVNDPFWDKDRDGKAVGRPFSSLIETIGVLANVTGDSNDLDPTTSLATPQSLSVSDRDAVLEGLGLAPGSDREEAIRLLKTVWRVTR